MSDRISDIPHSRTPRAMLEGLNSRSMPQRTCLIVFQTYHTAEPRRSMYALLEPYNMRKSPLFTKHVRLMSEHDFFCVAQATLGLLKLTQPGIVNRWSFKILQCVDVKTSQFGQNSGHPFVWQVMRLRPITTLAAALPPPSCPFSGSCHGAGNQPKQAQVRKPTPQLYSTAYNNNSFHVPDVRVVSCVRIIVLSYAGNNPVVPGPKHRVYCLHTTELLPAYDIRHNKRA